MLMMCLFIDGSKPYLVYIAKKYRQIRGRRPRRHVVDHLRDEAAVVARVIDEVLQDLAARHLALAAADEAEFDFLAQRRVGDSIAPLDVPAVELLLRAPELGERRVIG